MIGTRKRYWQWLQSPSEHLRGRGSCVECVLESQRRLRVNPKNVTGQLVKDEKVCFGKT